MKSFEAFKKEFLSTFESEDFSMYEVAEEHREMLAILTYIDFYCYEHFDSDAADAFASIVKDFLIGSGHKHSGS